MDRGSWSGSESPSEDMDGLSDSGGDKTMDGDPEGVWSPDIEQSFQEALAIYPPCGRRKIILSDEGKMYGRNELIARYIKLRTGKTRTRKQVSSHIQVLARRKSREFHSKLKDHSAKEKALQSISAMSSAQIVSATAIHSKLLPGIVRASFPSNAQQYNKHLFVHVGQSSPSYSDPMLECADLSYSVQEDPTAFYGVTSQYESSENMTITCSTKVCSFGKQVVEKVETEYARFENGRFVYRISRSPMCEYMINFIHKLKHLPEKYMMNSVLENFTILLVVSNRDTQETLLCMACVFEVSNNEHGAQHHIYRLVKE
ncbi:hypothetical protein CRUP_038798 [Coryphaenoides rupestris]|nr:hypothetical protein CRUP_038798 [Coryphaenoides rupestris]